MTLPDVRSSREGWKIWIGTVRLGLSSGGVSEVVPSLEVGGVLNKS